MVQGTETEEGKSRVKVEAPGQEQGETGLFERESLDEVWGPIRLVGEPRLIDCRWLAMSERGTGVHIPLPASRMYGGGAGS